MYTKYAGIILAGGGSTRFGQPKILLPWRGKPLIYHVAQAAIKAKLSPIIVVLGAVIDPIIKILGDFPVKIIINQDWRAGQSSSVRAGLQALPVGISGAIFLLADQPQVPFSLLNKMIDLHRSTLASVIIPQVEGHRSNPVLFNCTTFDDLKNLQGDIGGRGLFSKYEVKCLPWDDPNLRLDVDTPEDYQRLLKIE